jgi:hypothetical protein
MNSFYLNTLSNYGGLSVISPNTAPPKWSFYLNGFVFDMTGATGTSPSFDVSKLLPYFKNESPITLLGASLACSYTIDRDTDTDVLPKTGNAQITLTNNSTTGSTSEAIVDISFTNAAAYYDNAPLTSGTASSQTIVLGVPPDSTVLTLSVAWAGCPADTSFKFRISAVGVTPIGLQQLD